MLTPLTEVTGSARIREATANWLHERADFHTHACTHDLSPHSWAYTCKSVTVPYSYLLGVITLAVLGGHSGSLDDLDAWVAHAVAGRHLLRGHTGGQDHTVSSVTDTVVDTPSMGGVLLQLQEQHIHAVLTGTDKKNEYFCPV